MCRSSGPIRAVGAPGRTSPTRCKLRVPALRPSCARTGAGERQPATTAATAPPTPCRRRVLTVRARPDHQAARAARRRADRSYLAFIRVLTADAEQHLSLDGTADRRGAAVARPQGAAVESQRLRRAGGGRLRRGGDAAAGAPLGARSQGMGARCEQPRAGASVAAAARRGARGVRRSRSRRNPYDEYAYFYLGAGLRRASATYDKAEAGADSNSSKSIRSTSTTPGAPRRAVHGAAAATSKRRRQYEKAARGESRRRPGTHVQLGKAYLNLRRNRRGGGRVRPRGRRLSPTPSTWNGVAYQLSLAGVDLERAQQLRGVGDLVGRRRPRATSTSRAADARALDTARLARGLLGHARLGPLREGRSSRKAEPYVARAWAISQHAEVGDHLEPASTSGSAGRRRRSAPTPRRCRPTAPARQVRERLARVAGGAWEGRRARRGPPRGSGESRAPPAWRGRGRPARKPTS